MGGVTGAGLGAALGQAHGNTAAGAAIGTAVGALTGASVGNRMDQMAADNQALRAEQQRQIASATTIQDTVSMTQAGLSDEVIVNHVRARGMTHAPTISDLVAMKNAGVSDRVIQATQEMGALPVPTPAAVPVIVEERYVSPPVPVWGPPMHYPRWHRPPRYAYPARPGVSWGISFRN